MLDILKSLIDSDKLGGWVRALVASLFGLLAGWSGGKLAPFLTPDLQAAVGVLASTVVVGLWQHIAKSNAASTS